MKLQLQYTVDDTRYTKSFTDIPDDTTDEVLTDLTDDYIMLSDGINWVANKIVTTELDID